MKRILIIGARRSRQGIGEFLAKAFVDAGADVVAVVGTTTVTARQAQENLLKQYQINCEAYNSLEDALDKESVDIVAICSPFEFHLEQLKLVLEAGAHCLCEKPLVWGSDNSNITATQKIVDGFVDSKRHLSLVTQWPYTLSTFYKIYPQLKNQPVTEFEMLLSPIRPGTDMILDAAPHLLSMLQVLTGEGDIQKVSIGFSDNDRKLNLIFDYLQINGNKTAVKFKAAVCEKIPRPATYSINGCEISREIELPDYKIWFEGDGKREQAKDPIDLLVADYLEKVENKCPVDRQALNASVTGLDVLYKSALDHVSA